MHGLLSCLLLALATDRAAFIDWTSYEDFLFSAADPEGRLGMPPWHELFSLPGRRWQAWDARHAPQLLAKQRRGDVMALDMRARDTIRKLATEDPTSWNASVVELRGLYQSFIPLLVHVNPHLRAKLAGWYDDDAFRQLFCALLQPSEAVVRDTKELLSRHGRPMVGVHLRTTALNKGHVHSSWTAQRRLLDCTMATMARSTVARPPVFIAADTELARRRARTFFEQRGLEVIASEPQGNRSGAGQSFGSRMAALVDMLLLASCSELFVHERSTFSSTAYGIAGRRPYMVAPWDGLNCKQQPSAEPCAHSVRTARGLVSRLLGGGRSSNTTLPASVSYQLKCN